ncbi:hypothetical protein KAU33_04015 [Candidatus Dependentiae bacterium]|nr:hypothetical protein [Candidatus Dependentiae bacterium]
MAKKNRKKDECVENDGERNNWENELLDLGKHEEAMLDKSGVDWRREFNYPHNEPQRSEEALMMNALVIFGGEKVGMMTNPDLKNRPNFIEINGEKVVCLAQGGECRQHGQFYFSGGLNNPDSWKTPIISRGCEDRCPYKYLVCNGHDHAHDDGVDVFIPYPQYNKFCGEFERYCKDFKRIH